MSYRHLSLALGLLATLLSAGRASAQGSAEDSRPTTQIKLLTWNVQMLPVLAGFADLQKGQDLRAPWIVEYLSAQDYDVVVLQEMIDRRLTAQIRQGLQAAYPHQVAADPRRGVAGACGGVLFASRVPLTTVAHAVYENSTGVDALAEKGCLLVEGERDGVKFQIAGTHLQAGRDDVRDRQFEEMGAKIIRPHAIQGVPQLLVGDMNVRPTDPSFAKLLAATEMRDFPLDDPHPFTVDGQNSWNSPRKKPGRIDYVLLNPRGTASTITRQTIQRARREHEGRTVDYADHYGVVAEIHLSN